MSQVLSMWRKATALPVVGTPIGTRAFSLAFAQRAPYFFSIRPRFTVIEPNRAELVIRDRRGVHNHIGTVHAIALCNGLEAAMGALAEATIPADKRWIPKGMEVTYTAKAAGDVTCIAETDQAQWVSGPARPGSRRARRRHRGRDRGDPALGDRQVLSRGPRLSPGRSGWSSRPSPARARPRAG
jgi:acyl-coenzyme A thioesterase PaaI-like protein